MAMHVTHAQELLSTLVGRVIERHCKASENKNLCKVCRRLDEAQKTIESFVEEHA